jgi:uncharacterized membrane protein
MKKALIIIILIGFVITGLTLFYHEDDICTSSVRGYPFSVIIYPCLCYGYGDVDWGINFSGLMLNVLIYSLAVLIVYLIFKKLLNKKAPDTNSASFASLR